MNRINTFKSRQISYTSFAEFEKLIVFSPVLMQQTRPLDRLTSLLVQHNQSPDASIFALFPKDGHVSAKVAGGGREKKGKWRSVMRLQELWEQVAPGKYKPLLETRSPDKMS